MSAVITTSSTTGMNTSGSGDRLIIAPGVQIASSSGANAFRDVSVHTGVVLVNYGALIAVLTTAVTFEASGGWVRNEAGGLMSGGTNGLDSIAGPFTVSNLGTIVGITLHGISCSTGVTNADLQNSGYIFGKLGGITVSSGAATAVSIVNSGTIESDQYGLWLLNAFVTPVIDNSGTIRGKTASIYVENGDTLNLDNSGVLFGDVKCLSAFAGNMDDTIVNSGRIVGNVFLGPGNDSFHGTGGTTRGLYGEAGNDTIIGGRVAERIDGGAGRDVMSGGPGADRFVFNAIGDTGVGAALRDVISGFSRPQDDRINLSAIDADQRPANPGNDAFTFIGEKTFAGFHGVNPGIFGMIRFANGVLQGTVDGDMAPEFEIAIKGTAPIASDFIL